MSSKIDELRELIARRQVVVIVGAGVSLQATGGASVAGWRGLLESGIKHCTEFVVPRLPDGWKERTRALLDGDLDDWLTVASQIERRLGGGQQDAVGGEYRRWLAETVGQLEITDRGVLEALRDLGVPIATTNYDGLLTEVTGRPPVTWRDPPRAQRVLRGDEDGIVHFHGHWQDPASVVLGISTYEAVLGNTAAQALQQALRTMKCLLYVGYGAGLEDPNFGTLLAWARTTFRGVETYRHYRLALERDIDAVQATHPPEDRIFVVPYGTERSHLAPFLQAFAPVHPAPSPPSPRPASGRLPATGYCFGRKKLVRLLVRHVLTRTPAPVPILGGPGIGKSTLTLEVLHHPKVAEKFGDRRFFVRCDGAKSAAALVTEIARTLGLETAGGDLNTRVLTALECKPTILALDDAETPWESESAATEALLAQLGELSSLVLLASFRGARRPVGPRWRTSVDVGRLDPMAAREAFLAVAGNRFSDDSDLESVLSALDGVALAIKLLASAAEAAPNLAWVRERWLEERTKLMKRGTGRREEIGASLELSLNGPRMEKQESARQLLSLLSLLPVGAALRDLPNLIPKEAKSAADTLVGVGLAFHEGDRLRLLAPIREYIAEYYPPLEEDQERLVSFYLELVRDQGGRIGREGGKEAITRLVPELGNLDGVYDLSLASRTPSEAFKSAMRLGNLLRYSGLGDPRLLERIAERAEVEKELGSLATCILSLGDIALRRSDHQEARTRYEYALTIYQKVDFLPGEAACILSLGDIALSQSDHQEACMRYENALTVFQKVGSLLGEATCMQRLGDIALSQSDHQEARTRYENALTIFQKVGDLYEEANCIQRLGNIALYRSDFEGARKCYETAMPLYQRAGDLLGEANCIVGLGDIALAYNKPEAAREHFIEALGRYQRFRNFLLIGLTHLRLARLAHRDARDDHLDAARHAWTSIDRPDLVRELDDEFSSVCSPFSFRL